MYEMTSHFSPIIFKIFIIIYFLLIFSNILSLSLFTFCSTQIYIKRHIIPTSYHFATHTVQLSCYLLGLVDCSKMGETRDALLCYIK